MMQITEIRSALDSFETARDSYISAFRRVPAEAISFLKQGDDYSVGGITVHVTFVLQHYTNVLEAITSAGFKECRPQDPPGLEERALERAGATLPPAEVAAEIANTERLHQALVRRITGMGDDWSRKAPVWFGDAANPLPTSAADVLQWLTGHYHEHVPHFEALVSEWERLDGGRGDPLAVVARFNEAFARGDVDAVMALMTDDCIFENTFPAPDGERHAGADAVRAFWNRFFTATEAPRFETEELFAVDDRAVARWRFSWGTGTAAGHVRGADIFRVRDGKVAEKMSYVKG